MCHAYDTGLRPWRYINVVNVQSKWFITSVWLHLIIIEHFPLSLKYLTRGDSEDS